MPTRKTSQQEELPTPHLRCSKSDAEAKLSARIAAGEALKTATIQSRTELDLAEESLRKWQDYNEQLLLRIFSNEKIGKEYIARSGRGVYFIGESNLYKDIEDYREDVQRHVGVLASILERLELFDEAPEAAPVNTLLTVDLVRKLTGKFHHVARRLRIRHAGRPTLEISDEYDVQDLLHALLLLDFNDVREEEWTPSYAGGPSRVDFLLKNERTVIEVKKTRSGLADKELGNQLIIDAARYASVPGCDCLICFIYDPDGLVRNPHGLAADLEKLSTSGLKVVVEIHPK